jgi:hypothetical protein
MITAVAQYGKSRESTVGVGGLQISYYWLFCTFNTRILIFKFFYLWRHVSVLKNHLKAIFFTSRLTQRYTYSYSIHRLSPIQHNQHSNNWFSSHRKNSQISKDLNNITIPPNRKHQKHRRLHIIKKNIVKDLCNEWAYWNNSPIRLYLHFVILKLLTLLC